MDYKGMALDGKNLNGGKKGKSSLKRMKKDYQLYLFLLVPIVFLLIFSYWPMYGVLIAFEKYNPLRGIVHSKWMGFENFSKFFDSPVTGQYIKNTVIISIYSLLASMPFPIFLAILLNECSSQKFKKMVQMVTYAPYFISTVVMVSILMQLLDVRSGLVNMFIMLFGGKPVDFMASSSMFSSIYVWSGVWQGTGFNAIIYLAALSSVDPALYEAAQMDGITRLKRIFYIDMPSLLPTFTILFILSCGSIMNVGFEKIYLMQNPSNLNVSEVLSTYTYKMGLVSLNYGFSAAVGLFNSVVNTVLLVGVNTVSRKISETSLW